MKREERKVFNGLKRNVNENTINVAVNVNFSAEAKQAIHELLTIEKGMYAEKVCWNWEYYAILYVPAGYPAADKIRRQQENMKIDDVVNSLRVSDYTWTGHKKPTTETTETTEATETTETAETKGEKNMCSNSSKRPGKFERDEAIVNSILAKKPEEITAADRMQLIMIYSVSFHDTGKIEGTASLDSSCHGCTFCQKMMKAAEANPEIICGKCYDFRQENYRIAVKNRHMLNLRIMSSVSFTVEELAMLPTAMIDRINSSGDMENAIHAGNMVKYAIAHNAACVGLWAKNDAAVQEAFDTYGKPENVVYIASSPVINKKRALPKYADYTFTVYDAEHIDAAIANGSMECNGKKCKDCGFKCYYGTWPKGSDIAELLRK